MCSQFVKLSEHFPSYGSSSRESFDADKKFILNSPSSIINHTQNITKTTSMMNTTEKINITNRNKLIISLWISFVLIILCISFSYCIFLYLKHYLNTTLDMKQDTSELNRLSIATSAYSDDTQLCRYKIEDRTNEQRYIFFLLLLNKYNKNENRD
jgi:hypothetical protein